MKKNLLVGALVVGLAGLGSFGAEKVEVADLPSQHSQGGVYLADLPSQHSQGGVYLADLPSQHSQGGVYLADLPSQHSGGRNLV